MTDDALEGFGSANQIEQALRKRMGDHDFLVDLWQMGEQMRLFTETPAGKLLETTFRQDLNDALLGLLNAQRLDDKQLRDLVEEARLNWRLLQKIEETLGSGIEAETLMTENDTQR